MTNQVIENILARKSVRSFTQESVPEEMIETMLRAAMAAPSSKNRQPAEFVVITDRAVLDRLAAGLRHAKMLAQAPLAIAVYGQTVCKGPDGAPATNIFWEQDCAAAVENLLLAAESLGLGAVWTAASDPERSEVVTHVLGDSGTCRPHCVIPIGFPAGNEVPKDKWNPSKIHRNRW